MRLHPSKTPVAVLGWRSIGILTIQLFLFSLIIVQQNVLNFNPSETSHCLAVAFAMSSITTISQHQLPTVMMTTKKQQRKVYRHNNRLLSSTPNSEVGEKIENDSSKVPSDVDDSTLSLLRGGGSNDVIDSMSNAVTLTTATSDNEENSIRLPQTIPTLPTLRQYIQFALPCLALWIAGPLLSLVDTSFIGLSSQGGNSARQLAALGPATTLYVKLKTRIVQVFD
jgi:hypothetical protein